MRLSLFLALLTGAVCLVVGVLAVLVALLILIFGGEVVVGILYGRDWSR